MDLPADEITINVKKLVEFNYQTHSNIITETLAILKTVIIIFVFFVGRLQCKFLKPVATG